MKRLELSVLFLSLLLIVPLSAKSEPKTKGTILQLCYDLWKRTSFGWNEKQSEKAAWVVRGADGGFEWLEWPEWQEHNRISWLAGVPERLVALVHTHPNGGKPEPSKQDARVAKAINAPVYAISGSGIWSVNPNGTIRKEADEHWYKKLQH